MSDFFSYYKRFFLHWGKEVLSFGREQVVGVILAVLILLFQLYTGLIPARDAALAAKVTLLWPYLGLIGIYLIVHLVRTPWKLDQELRSTLVRQASRKEIESQIELLTTLADRGQEIMRRCRNENELFPVEELGVWSNETSKVTETIFDPTYVSRLGSGVGVPMGIAHWPNLGNAKVDGFTRIRVFRLQEFIDELRERLKTMG